LPVELGEKGRHLESAFFHIVRQLQLGYGENPSNHEFTRGKKKIGMQIGSVAARDGGGFKKENAKKNRFKKGTLGQLPAGRKVVT